MNPCKKAVCPLEEKFENGCAKCGFNKEVEAERKKELREQFHTHDWNYPFRLRIKAGD